MYYRVIYAAIGIIGSSGSVLKNYPVTVTQPDGTML
jgi:hypothetical protein